MAATEVEAGEGGGPVVRLTAPDEEEEVMFVSMIVIIFITIIVIIIKIIDVISSIFQVPLKPCGCRHPCGCEKPCTFTELKVPFAICLVLLCVLVTYKL